MYKIGPEVQSIRQTNRSPRMQDCGFIRDFRITQCLAFGVGGHVARSFTRGGLDLSYGSDRT